LESVWKHRLQCHFRAEHPASSQLCWTSRPDLITFVSIKCKLSFLPSFPLTHRCSCCSQAHFFPHCFLPNQKVTQGTHDTGKLSLSRSLLVCKNCETRLHSSVLYTTDQAGKLDKGISLHRWVRELYSYVGYEVARARRRLFRTFERVLPIIYVQLGICQHMIFDITVYMAPY
jgi:hypothetical protein